MAKLIQTLDVVEAKKLLDFALMNAPGVGLPGHEIASIKFVIGQVRVDGDDHDTPTAHPQLTGIEIEWKGKS